MRTCVCVCVCACVCVRARARVCVSSVAPLVEYRGPEQTPGARIQTSSVRLCCQQTYAHVRFLNTYFKRLNMVYANVTSLHILPRVRHIGMKFETTKAEASRALARARVRQRLDHHGRWQILTHRQGTYTPTLSLSPSLPPSLGLSHPMSPHTTAVTSRF